MIMMVVSNTHIRTLLQLGTGFSTKDTMVFISWETVKCCQRPCRNELGDQRTNGIMVMQYGYVVNKAYVFVAFIASVCQVI